MSWSGPSTKGIQVSGRPAECSPIPATSIAIVWVPDADTSIPRIDGTTGAEALIEQGLGGDTGVHVWPETSSVWDSIFEPDQPDPETIFGTKDGGVAGVGGGTGSFALGSGPRLRMYGIEVGDIVSDGDPKGALSYVNADRSCTAANPAEFEPLAEDPALLPCTFAGETDTGEAEISAGIRPTGAFKKDDYVQFFDAINVSLPGGGTEPQFWVLKTEERGGAPLLRSTCIQKHLRYPVYNHTSRNYVTGEVTLKSGPAIVYRDAIEVLKLPDGRWLMLLQSSATPVTSYESFDASDFRKRSDKKDCTYMDIVCFLADDADFRTNLVGPLRVVDGKHALPESELPGGLAAPARLFVGVPAGVVRGDYLYVYYAYAPAYHFDDRAGNPDEDLLSACMEGTSGGDAAYLVGIGRQAYEDAFKYFQAGIAVKRIALADLYLRAGVVADQFQPANDTVEALLDAFGYMLGQEAQWELLEYYWPGSSAIPGDLLGKVRVWVDTPPTFLFSELPFEHVMCAGDMIDPSPVLCPETDRLSLYFTFTKCSQPGTGGGLWRAREHVVGESSPLIDLLYEPGKDFHVDVSWDGGGNVFRTADRLADIADPSDPGATGQFQNADAIRMRDGTWRVYSGGGWNNAFGSNQATLNLFEGDGSDGGCA